MPSATIDTRGYPVLVRGRSETRGLGVEDDTGADVSIADGGTVTLYDVAGTSRGTGTTSGGGVTYTVSSDCPDGAAVEVWSITAGGKAYIFRVDVAVTKSDIPCLVTDGDLEERIEPLGAFPPGRTTWWKWRFRGWNRMLREVMARHGSLSLWAPGVLYDAGLAAAMANVLQTAASYGAQPWADLAAAWEQRYQQEIDRLTVRLDTDADQAPDTDPRAQATGVSIGQRYPTRVG